MGQVSMRWMWLPVLALLGLQQGCVHQPPPPPAPAPVPSPEPCPQPDAEIARLKQLLAQKDAEIARLQQRQNVQERKLDDTSQEVARAQVKLRSLANEADAAAQQAEVEIALRAFQAKLSDGEVYPEAVQARQLLARSGEAFKGGDYGAAVDLAGKAKQLLDLAGARRSGGYTEASSDQEETAFETPIPLRVGVKGNLRAEPARTARVVVVLEPGAVVTAVAYRGEWLRVTTTEGQAGWVFRSLLRER